LIRGRAAKAEGQNAQTQCVRGHISAKGREAMRSSAIMLIFDANSGCRRWMESQA
jgi:hypothetical protein